ncbi:MAG: hypothetical protein H7Z11_23865, partial [Verrucomicrobia bacterium]|nr:hypothetical protein [Leptolyngbya sp. ES-bin-22]
MKRTIATTILLGTLLVGGVTACSQPNTLESPQGNTTPATSQSTDTQPSDRTQKREAMRKQIEAVLTPKQSQQLQAKLQQGARMREAMASLNLTPEQKTKIQNIMKAARAK